MSYAEERIAAVMTAAEELAAAVRREMEIELNRPEAKSLAIGRLMQLPNPDTGKPHSGSSAEKVVELDAEYHDYCTKKIASVEASIIARAAYESAKLAARLAVTLAADLAGAAI